ncbi:hypothetical protein [Nitrosomonas sp.]
MRNKGKRFIFTGMMQFTEITPAFHPFHLTAWLYLTGRLLRLAR